MRDLGDPKVSPISIWLGDDEPAKVFPFDGDFTGAQFILVLQWYADDQVQSLVRSSIAGELTVDAGAKTVTWPYAIGDLAAIRHGPARYELKRIAEGRTRTILWGEVKLKTGLLDPLHPTGGSAESAYVDARLAAERSYVDAALDAIRAQLGGGGGVGGSGDPVLTLIAASDLSGHRVVRGLGGGVALCSVADPDDAETAIGITEGAALAGAPVVIRYGGLMTDTTWAWVEGPVFAAPDGRLTQAPARAAFEQRVGTAISATQIVVEIEPAFIFAA